MVADQGRFRRSKWPVETSELKWLAFSGKPRSLAFGRSPDIGPIYGRARAGRLRREIPASVD